MALSKVEGLFDILTAMSKAEWPFDRPFDKLTVLSKVEGLMALSKAEGPFDMLTVLSKAEGLRSASSPALLN